MATRSPKRTRTYSHWGAYDVETAGGTIPEVGAFEAPTILPD